MDLLLADDLINCVRRMSAEERLRLNQAIIGADVAPNVEPVDMQRSFMLKSGGFAFVGYEFSTHERWFGGEHKPKEDGDGTWTANGECGWHSRTYVGSLFVYNDPEHEFRNARHDCSFRIRRLCGSGAYMRNFLNEGGDATRAASNCAVLEFANGQVTLDEFVIHSVGHVTRTSDVYIVDDISGTYATNLTLENKRKP